MIRLKNHIKCHIVTKLSFGTFSKCSIFTVFWLKFEIEKYVEWWVSDDSLFSVERKNDWTVQSSNFDWKTLVNIDLVTV